MQEKFEPNALQSIFWAQSIAVVGASSSPHKLGHIILKNVLEGGFQGKIYPINPGGGKILGLDVFPNIEAIPGKCDLVIFCIPAHQVIPSMFAAAEKSASGAIIISGGFRETGNQDLETQLVETARQLHIRLVGPNCQGINFTPNRLCASWPLFTRQGALAVISQSGTIAAALAGWAEEDGLGISGVISLGNQADLCETDFLEVFGQDQQTRVIAMYIEGVKDGRRFMQVASRISKPVIVLKSGRTPGGVKAAASHTKSLAGSDQVFSGICNQLGILRVETIEELYDVARGLPVYTSPAGPRLAIITSSGGSGILAVDAAEKNGLHMAEMDDEMRTTLSQSALPKHMVIGNPLDLTGSALSSEYVEAMQIFEHSQPSDMYLLIFGDPIPGSAERLAPVIGLMKKPVAVCYLGGGNLQAEETARFQAEGIPVYATPERAVSFLAKLSQRGQRLQKPKENCYEQ